MDAMVHYKATGKSSATGVYRDTTREFIINSLNNYHIPSDLVLTREQATDVKRVLEDLFRNNKSEIQIQGMLLDLATEISCYKQVVASVIAKLWIACCWKWSYLVESYLTKRDWEKFIYNFGWANQLSLPRTDDVNRLIRNPIKVSFEGTRKGEDGSEESYYFEKEIQI